MRDHIEFDFQSTASDIEFFLFSVGCSIIAMSSNTSYSSDLRDHLEQRVSSISFEDSVSFGWAYGLSWSSAGVARLVTVIASIGLCVSPRDTGNPTMRFKLRHSCYHNL